MKFILSKWNETICFKKLKQELKKTYRFYFDRGDSQYKEDYKKVFYAILRYEPNAEFKLSDLTYYERLYRECISDNPLLFYVENVTFSIGAFGVRMLFNYTYNSGEVENIYKIIFECLKKVRLKLRDADEEVTVKNVHDYVVQNVVYDNDSSIPVHQAQCFFIHGRAVCDGISKATKVILDSVNIKSMVISGDALTPNTKVMSDTGHAWNIIWINNHPDHFDFTFDTNLSASKKTIRYDYYGLSDEQIKRDHTFDSIGVLTNGDNNWFTKNGLYFTKKVEIKKHIKNSLRSNVDYIAFKLPFTANSKATLDEITDIVKSEMKLNILKSFTYSMSINEAQMVIYIFL